MCPDDKGLSEGIFFLTVDVYTLMVAFRREGGKRFGHVSAR